MNYIGENKCRIVEGELRSRELRKYLDDLGLPDDIWICEDASGIVAKIQHDSTTNQLVGLALPLNSETGLPIPFTYIASSAEDIQRFIRYEKSSLVYLVLAQPLVEGVPPFILQIFGTNNKFTAQDVSRRWEHTMNELKK